MIVSRARFAVLLCISAILLSAMLPGTAPARPADQATSANVQTFSLRAHPDGALYVGDQVSFQVMSNDAHVFDSDMAEVHIRVETPEPVELGTVKFDRYPDRKELRANFAWVWDTSGLEPGEYTLQISTRPEIYTWSEQVTLLPADQRPENETGARWEQVRSACCELHYISGTAADRDLVSLVEMVDEEAESVSAALGVDFEDPVKITLLPRVLGHGGFASDQIYLSYLDRNYAGGTTRQVLHHELVHILDGQLGGERRPTILVEGLAVYFSGGHFKPEPLAPRARALLALDGWIPLPELADDFYGAQHETGYLQAAALIEWMVERWSWEEFNAFYRDIHPDPSGKDSAALETALRKHFGLSLSELEEEIITSLKSQPVDSFWKADVAATLRYYDTMRAYQKALDPSAYFRQVWLPNGDELREKGIVADYLRRPGSPANDYLEQLLTASEIALRGGEFEQASRLLAEVDQRLAVEDDLQALALLFQPRLQPLGVELSQ